MQTIVLLIKGCKWGICLIILVALFSQSWSFLYGSVFNLRDRVYNCSEVSYPIAIDIPQEVIKLCKKVKK